jgi:hypothetical protein
VLLAARRYHCNASAFQDHIYPGYYLIDLLRTSVVTAARRLRVLTVLLLHMLERSTKINLI